MIPMAGDHFGPYEILGTLGRGGVGEVYRAWDRRLEREVALKLLHDEYPQPGNRERFMIEARAASALNHANICTIFDVGSKDGWPYLVMELLKGITLKEKIARSSMSAEEIVRVAMEMAGALGAAHALGIIHRDVKPANVMLVKQADGRTRVKVLDFGLAKLTGPLPGQLSHREEHLTVVGEAVGTVSYMSPEQARGDELDGRTDLFSLGVVMYEMATRRTPFHGSTTALLFAQLLGKDPEPIREWNDSIPRPLEKIIFRLLEGSVAEVSRCRREVVEALEQVAQKMGGSRWRRVLAPAVPLVRVEEPVARPGTAGRGQEFLREHARAAHRSGSGDLRQDDSRGSAMMAPRGLRALRTPPEVHAGGEQQAVPGNAGAAASRSRMGSRPDPARLFRAVEISRVGAERAGPTWRSPLHCHGGRRSSVGVACGFRAEWPRLCFVLPGAVFTVRAAGGHGAALGPGRHRAEHPSRRSKITRVCRRWTAASPRGLEFDLAQTPALSIRTAARVPDGQSTPSARMASRFCRGWRGRRPRLPEPELLFTEMFAKASRGRAAAGQGSRCMWRSGDGRDHELAAADARAARTEEIPGAIDAR